MQLGRTRTIPLSLEPVWTNPEERFVVAVGFEDAAKCDLTLEVWDDDHLGQGDFLGQVDTRFRVTGRMGGRGALTPTAKYRHQRYHPFLTASFVKEQLCQ